MAYSVRISILTGSTFLAEYILSRLEENGDKELIHRINREQRDMQELPEMPEDRRTDIIFTQSRYASRIDSNKNYIETIFSAPDAVFIPRVSITCGNTEPGKDNVRLGRGSIWGTACCTPRISY